MKINTYNAIDKEFDLLVIPVCENKNIHTDSEISNLINPIKNNPDFTGKDGESLITYPSENTSSKRIFYSGIGKSGSLSDEKFRKYSGEAVQWAIKKKCKTIAFVIPDSKAIRIKFENITRSTIEGAFLANRVYSEYQTDKKKSILDGITILTSSSKINATEQICTRAKIICEGTNTARDLVSTPPNDKTPSKISKIIQSMFKGTSLTYSSLSFEDMVKLKFNALLAVAAGSSNKPEMLVAEYTPEKYTKTILIVGKGVTFDSGGLNLKPGSGLIEMKMDMGGAAATAGTMLSIEKLKPGIRVIGLMPFVENMPSGNAARPGDIIKSYGGKTIEIGNTDAEGRLVLADAISYGKKQYKPDYIVDIATLTGACMVALGKKIAGIFANDESFRNALIDSSKSSGEPCWALPLYDDYSEMLKSEIADISNMASARWGGAITAALFLKEFAGNTSWAHIDIAGPAFDSKGSAYCSPGGTGFGVRLLCDLISNTKTFR